MRELIDVAVASVEPARRGVRLGALMLAASVALTPDVPVPRV